MTIRLLKSPPSYVALFRSAVTALLLLCAGAITPGVALAVVVENLFEVEIPVPDESREIRNAAMSDGLVEVLIRVSGDSEILQKLKPPSAAAYVKQFRYIAIEPPPEPAATDAVQDDVVIATHRLWVQYNSTRIMELLRTQMIPIWSEHRNQAVVWLAVRDGVNQYILKKQDISLLKSSADNAFNRRGLPVIWPYHDNSDQQQLQFADIWAGFAEPLRKTSKRYSTGPIIAASMSWNGYSWLADWSLFVGRESWRWSLEDADYNALITRAIELLADNLGKTYAVLEAGDAASLEQVLVEIDAVKSVTDFRQTQDYLLSLSAVQAVWLSQVEAERVEFRLKLRSDVDDLLKLIKTDKKLEPLSGFDSLELPVAGMAYRFRKNN